MAGDSRGGTHTRTQLAVPDAHVALQQVVHVPGGLLFKLALLAEAWGKYASVSLERGDFQTSAVPLPGTASIPERLTHQRVLLIYCLQFQD